MFMSVFILLGQLWHQFIDHGRKEDLVEMGGTRTRKPWSAVNVGRVLPLRYQLAIDVGAWEVVHIHATRRNASVL